VDGGGGKLLERSACWPMCGGMEEWRSDGGNGAWFPPPTEEVAESGYCMELGIAGGGGSIGDGVSKLWSTHVLVANAIACRVCCMCHVSRVLPKTGGEQKLVVWSWSVACIIA
jgi:hypothetical protein